MGYTQLVTPNLDTQGQAGYCLATQEDAWGTAHEYPCAEDAFNNAQFKHPDEQPPEDVMVPVYWTYYDTGAQVEYGHIATYVPGRGVFSSPFNIAYGNQWFGSIQEVTDRINRIAGANSRYLGWTEDLAGTRLVEEQTVSVAQLNGLEINEIITAFHGVPANDSDMANFVGRPLDDLLAYVTTSGSRTDYLNGIQADKDRIATDDQTIADLRSKITDLEAKLSATPVSVAVPVLSDPTPVQAPDLAPAPTETNTSQTPTQTPASVPESPQIVVGPTPKVGWLQALINWLKS